MEIQLFIDQYREAFSEKAELPVAFWYSDQLEGDEQKTQGCFFKAFKQIRAGEIVSLNADTIGCGGGKFYTGFSDMPPHVPTFVSIKEKYMQTPEMVLDMLKELRVCRTTQKYLHFARLDQLANFNAVAGLLFLATPDILSGLSTWAYFDNGRPDAVIAPFGSGCCNVVTRAIQENQKGGSSCILGFFDPSVRPYFEANLLSFTIPMSRFRTMYHTMRSSCLYDTTAWGKIKKRIAEGE